MNVHLAEIGPDVTPTPQAGRLKVIVLACSAGLVLAWCYAPVLQAAWRNWREVPDYSHGFFVAPIAAIMLWTRRDRLPGSLEPRFAGLAGVLLAVAMRLVAGWGHLAWLDGWSLPVALAALAFAAGGLPLLGWAWPALAFLVFMFPLPWRIEELLAGPLQRVAAHWGSWLLVCLGQPALAEGSVIHLDTDRLEVSDACSGLRMFMGITGLVAAYVVVSSRPAWQRILILVASAPAAVAANVVRVAITGMAYQSTKLTEVRQWWHDLAGWMMIPMAAGMVGVFVFWLDQVARRERTASPADLARDPGWFQEEPTRS